MSQEEKLAIRNQAIKYLSYREHSCAELMNKLGSKFDEHTNIEEVVRELSEEGLQSDQRFVELYLQGRARKGFGRRYIENALLFKGVSKSDVASGFKACQIDWFDVLYQSWDKKFSGCVPENLKERAKQYRFLSSRGFSNQEIGKVYTSLLD